MYLHPTWDRTCTQCQKWEYDDEEGTPPGRKGLPILDSSASPIPRVTDTPCWRCPKVPGSTIAHKQATGDRVTHEDAIEPGEEHRQAVKFFAECAAVGSFPNDPWARRVAALLRPIERAVEQRSLNTLCELIQVLVASK